MKLYFAPMACSFVIRVVAGELEVALEYQQVELFTKVLTGTTTPYQSISPLELIPCLVLDGDSGAHGLTEVAAIAQFLADQRPASTILPPPNTLERYRVLSLASFFATEIHKRVLWVLVQQNAPREAKQFALSFLPRALASLDHLGEREFLVGDTFTLADAYLAWIVSLLPTFKVDLTPALRSYAGRILQRPSVRDALAIELPLLEEALQRQLPKRHQTS